MVSVASVNCVWEALWMKRRWHTLVNNRLNILIDMMMHMLARNSGLGTPRLLALNSGLHIAIVGSLGFKTTGDLVLVVVLEVAFLDRNLAVMMLLWKCFGV